MLQRTESIDKFLMMVGTKQVVDEDGLQYLVTSLAVDKRQGLIAAYREMVMCDSRYCM